MNNKDHIKQIKNKASALSYQGFFEEEDDLLFAIDSYIKFLGHKGILTKKQAYIIENRDKIKEEKHQRKIKNGKKRRIKMINEWINFKEERK